MPVYMAHGFRWPRDGFTGIRVWAIVNDLEDVSVEYIQNENSRRGLLENFRSKFPDQMKELEKSGRAIDFLEQYDPMDTRTVSQPWAFVCDRIVLIAGGERAQDYAGQLLHRQTGESGRKKERKKTLPMTISAPHTSPATINSLSLNIDEVQAEGTGGSNDSWVALSELRDQIAKDEVLGWWVVYNGDPDRAFGEDDEDEDEGEEGQDGERNTATPVARPPTQATPKSPTMGGRMPPPIPPTRAPLMQRSSTHSTLTTVTSSTGTTPSRPVSDATGSMADASKSKSASKGQSIKKFFGKKG